VSQVFSWKLTQLFIIREVLLTAFKGQPGEQQHYLSDGVVGLIGSVYKGLIMCRCSPSHGVVVGVAGDGLGSGLEARGVGRRLRLALRKCNLEIQNRTREVGRLRGEFEARERDLVAKVAGMERERGFVVGEQAARSGNETRRLAMHNAKLAGELKSEARGMHSQMREMRHSFDRENDKVPSEPEYRLNQTEGQIHGNRADLPFSVFRGENDHSQTEI